MDTIVFLLGIVLNAGGVCLLVYHALMFLVQGQWLPWSMLWLVERGPEALQDWVAASPTLDQLLAGCPLYVFCIVLGLLLMLIGKRLGCRFL